jgi:hypothetical protein
MHDYAKPGSYRVRLTVTDAAGAEAATTFAVEVGGEGPIVEISMPGVYTLVPGATIQLHAQATSADGSSLPADSLHWRGILHHNEHTHIDYFSAIGASPTLTWDDHGANTWMELCVEATDHGKQGKACVELQPDQGATNAVMSDEKPIVESTSELPPDVVPRPDGASGLLQEIWFGVGGATIADLEADARFPNSPDERGVAGVDLALQGKDYGERLRGYLIAPETGDYRFWIASDDEGELWLSESEDAGAARLIAHVSGYTPRNGYDVLPGQASGVIHLEAGVRYYIEILHKQADIKDNLSVAWQPPAGERQTIPVSALQPLE